MEGERGGGEREGEGEGGRESEREREMGKVFVKFVRLSHFGIWLMFLVVLEGF